LTPFIFNEARKEEKLTEDMEEERLFEAEWEKQKEP